MAKQIIWTKKAQNELIDILEYWNNRNKSNSFSIKLNNFIKEQLNLIGKYPNIGRKTDIRNVNLKVIHKYLLYYQISNEEIYILTIRHGSKNPKSLRLK